MRVRKSAISRVTSQGLLLALLLAGLALLVAAQDEPAPPPPPPEGAGMMMGMHGPEMGIGFFHEEMGEGHRVVTGAPMTLVQTTTRDTTLADGNTIHTENGATVYRDSQGRVRREVEFELVTPTTGAAKHTMIMINDPVSGHHYMLNPQTKVAHDMPLHPPKQFSGEAGAGAPGPMWKSAKDVTTEQLGSKTILGLPAQGTRVTHTIPAGQIGNAKPIKVVTERWVSTDLQVPLSMTHSDPMVGTVTTKATSVNRGEPDAALFQVPPDYKIESGKPGDMLYMKANP